MARLLAVALLLALGAQETPAWLKRLEEASSSAEKWKARRAEIRTQILVSAGLWPELERPPLKPAVYGKVEGDGYTIERVRVETLPGFHLTGSLYRPRGKSGPFPAVASPHGHWGQGRFTQTNEGNLPARGITFARLGFVCFMYDMVGYADFKQLPHKYEDPAWGIGLLGLQLWNSLRAVDFIESLPDVDAKRIGCTGASGGGTQTFLLTAVDDRIQCAAPVNMVAAEFQGGCSCENAPFLRIDLNNVEIAAATAPRPLLLVSCTGDWTKNTMTLEGPAVKSAYKALGVEERVKYVQFNYGHNYNKDSREAVYAWFVRWLQNGPDQEKVAEPDVPVVKREDLTVWTPDVKPPEGAVDAEGLKKVLREKVIAQIDALRPKDADSLKRFRDAVMPALRVMFPLTKSPVHSLGAPSVLIVTPEPGPEAAPGKTVLVLQPHVPELPAGGNKDQLKGFPTCFFRTELNRQVQDVVDMAAAQRSNRLVGLKSAGLPTLLAAALLAEKPADVAVDLDGGALPSHPSLQRIDALRTAAILLAPAKLVLYNAQGRVDLAPVRDAYKAAGAAGALTIYEKAEDWARAFDAVK
jgi:dienelactone hydrolase